MMTVRDESPAFGMVTLAPGHIHGDAGHAMNMYCKFCSDVSVASDDPTASVLKMLVLFQKNVNVQKAYTSLFTDKSFLDWERVFLLKNNRAYNDSSTWVVMVQYLDIRLQESEFRTLSREHPLFAHFADCLRKARMTVEPSSMAALYLLVNISRLESLHTFEQFFSMRENRDVRKEALMFFSQLANVQFDRDEQTTALIALLRQHCVVRSSIVMQELDIMQQRANELQGLFRQKVMRAVLGRPRLRSKLKAQPAAGSMFQLDFLSHWCNTIRFPNVFSLTQKKRLYFVMSQVHLDHQHYIKTLLPDRDFSDTVLKYPVKQPEVDVVYETISACRVINEPFAELHQFRAECFHSFALEQKARLRLNDLLHLYIAAYQQPSVWKSVWKLVFPVLSIQIIRDVESFVDRVPFCHAEVIAIMFNKPLDEVQARRTEAPTVVETPTTPKLAMTPDPSIEELFLQLKAARVSAEEPGPPRLVPDSDPGWLSNESGAED